MRIGVGCLCLCLLLGGGVVYLSLPQLEPPHLHLLPHDAAHALHVLDAVGVQLVMAAQQQGVVNGGGAGLCV